MIELQKKMDKGLVYVVDDPIDLKYDKGNKFIKEAKISIESMRRFHKPCPPITIFTNHASCNIKDINLIQTDHDNYLKNIDIRGKRITHVRGHKANCIENLMQTPYEYNLHLDSDVFCITPVLNDIFKLLDNFDMAVVHTGVVSPHYDREIPATYPEFNSGVIAYKKSTCMGLFQKWLDLYTAVMSGHDQNTFRVACWESKLRIAVMPQQYNWKYKGSLPLVDSEKPKDKWELMQLDWWKRVAMPKLIHSREQQKLYAEGKLEKYCGKLER